jgi:phenolic acid decarboxylase
MNKAIIILIGLLLISNASAIVFQHGSSRDIVQGYDRGWLWYHLYLKNDHATAYCFDNSLFAVMFEESQRTQKEVIVTYETYLFRGSFCMTSERYDNVVVTNVRWAE